MNGSSQVTDTMLEEDVHIDQKYLDKQSRTIGTYGLETMTKLISFKVLIVGCGGVGVEIAKNLALAGIHTISLHDPRKPEARDIGVNFCINADSLQSGRNMAELSAAYLAELNPNTNIRVVTELTEEGVGHHHALIFTSAAPNISLTTLVQWNQFCRSHTPAISFMFAFQGGTMGSVFVDHGPLFTVKDADGRPMLQKSITEVVTRTDKSGQSYSRIRFETPEGQTPGALRDYTQIKLTEVKGMCKSDGSSVNNNVYQGTVCPCDPPHTVRVYPSFESQGYSAYETGGFVHELKETIQMTFRPLEEALHSPGSFVIVSPMMDGNEESLTHVTLNAFLRYADKHDGRLPPLHNAEAAKEVVELARSVITENRSRYCRMEPLPDQAPENSEFPTKLPPPPPASPLVTDDLNESHISIQAMIAQAELQPLAAVFGAVVAQEVVKISGKYTPIHQWFHFSCESVLPADVDFTDGEYKLLSSRYDHQIAIFGRRFHEKLQGLKLFMVGCGALGCENIKNFALCGISCGQGGSIVVTDNDRIEISNLSRQFLFREDNVGQSKSVAATRRMLQMNPDANPDARQDFIGPTTEHLFPDTFWSGLDVVVNALDNMEARLYVDQMCVRFNKVLIEAGTMGTGGNVDIVVPGSTTSYADGGAADQTGGIPMCTLRNFPYMYDHCIEWARSLFDDLFVAPMQAAIQIIENPSRFREKIEKDIAGAVSTGEKRSLIQKHLGPLRGLQRTLQILADGPNLQKCVELGWDGLFKIFRDRIYDLQAAFPHDAKKKNGDPFWSGNRKFPSALEATAETVCKSPDIQNYLISAINLYACMFGIHPAKPDARFNDEKHRWMGQYRTLEWLQNAVQGLNVPKYVAGAVGDLDEDLAPSSQNGKETTMEEDAQELSGLLTSLMDLSARCSGATAAPLEFEKDDDDNFQMDYIAAASNLRATNYVIPTEDRMKVKLVAGKIIPAIATTTSVVTGLALLELFKVLQGKDVSTLRNGMVDIGTNNYVLFERDAPHTHRHRIVTTYFPEQDYTYRKKIVCIPEGFTKYDTIPIPVTPKTTVLEFTEMAIKSLNKRLPEGAQYSCEVDGIGVGKGMIWNGSKKHANTERPIMDVIEQQMVSEMETPPPHGFWHNRLHFYDLSVTVSVDDEDDSVDEIDVETAVIRLDITE